jgi:hypothetical protein
MQDKVQEKQNDEKQNDALPPAEGDDDGWTAVLSPVLAVGGFLSSVVSPAPLEEDLYSAGSEENNAVSFSSGMSSGYDSYSSRI